MPTQEARWASRRRQHARHGGGAKALQVGGLCGLSWAAGLRGFMAQIAGPESTVAWAGTFGWILRPGMRVLDLGCGRGASSVFLHQEFGVRVSATDLWFSADERAQRIRDAGAEDAVFPVHAEARALPFAAGFFDAVISIDSFPYYGTDDLYLNYPARLVKPGGLIGIAGAGMMKEIDGPLPERLPEHLRGWWELSMACLHTADWWRRHWQRSQIAHVELADSMPDGWRYWLDWQQAVAPDNAVEIDTLTADQGRYLGYVRAVARRRGGTTPDELVASIPSTYTRHPVYRT